LNLLFIHSPRPKRVHEDQDNDKNDNAEDQTQNATQSLLVCLAIRAPERIVTSPSARDDDAMARAKSSPTLVAFVPGRLVAAVATSPVNEYFLRLGNVFKSFKAFFECAAACHDALARSAIHVAMLRAVELAAVLALAGGPVLADMADHRRLL
jgi:hypothetical protein